ncbi:carbohydrate ABC transporter permease [Hydromonas duriensis]|uniref:Sorbitol ABC transporter membrane protein /mannitol ABC transporter membrane protein n=1 Tax=Hydromonas duriensis TaxID=1527608 RepID=A0A4R6Y5K8_9BURK|nr:sugar ABC transporter permease [Hydromonas duriensis]TDR30393.1 sorbitol ABC transporter membrane protein /mannitol ABC transporter membrane protein [Hydromonas duriensis]
MSKASANPVAAKRKGIHQSKLLVAQLLLTPAVAMLFIWMVVPLVMTLWNAMLNYNLLSADVKSFAWFSNYKYLVKDADFWVSIVNSVLMIGTVLVMSVVVGSLLAWLYDQDFKGRNIARLFVIAPFFVMPTVSALLWKNMMFHPVYGLIGAVMHVLGLQPVDWFKDYPMLAVIIILWWQWMPFAFLILLTAIQSVDSEQKEAAKIDGAKPWHVFWFIILPHLKRAISVVVMIEAIFLLSAFAEIHITTGGGPGNATTNLTYFVFLRGIAQFDIGLASAGGVIAVILANIISFFLIRTASKNLQA